MNPLERVFELNYNGNADGNLLVYCTMKFSTDSINEFAAQVKRVLQAMSSEFIALRRALKNSQFVLLSNPEIPVEIIQAQDKQSLISLLLNRRIDLSGPLLFAAVSNIESETVLVLGCAHMILDADGLMHILHRVLANGSTTGNVQPQPQPHELCSFGFFSLIIGFVLHVINWLNFVVFGKFQVLIRGKGKNLHTKQALIDYPFKTCTDSISSDTVLQIARKNNTTVTALVSGAYIKAFYETLPVKNRILFGTSINMRKFFNRKVAVGCYSVSSFPAIYSNFTSDSNISDFIRVAQTIITQENVKRAVCASLLFRFCPLKLLLGPSSSLAAGTWIPMSLYLSNVGEISSKFENYYFNGAPLQVTNVSLCFATSIPFLGLVSFKGALNIGISYRNAFLSDHDAQLILQRTIENVLSALSTAAGTSNAESTTSILFLFIAAFLLAVACMWN